MPLFTLADAELAFGDLPLLDGASLAMEAGERVRLTKEEVEAYLQRHGRDATSLIVASRLTGDLALLREAKM